jgi:3-hydroxyisobutyrate dehydrogenase-like beta-hydroxyacid dehydrogenase
MAKIGFIGLGVMGYPMAGHLQRHGHAVTVYNRSLVVRRIGSRRLAAHPHRHPVTAPEAKILCSHVLAMIMTCAA